MCVLPEGWCTFLLVCEVGWYASVCLEVWVTRLFVTNDLGLPECAVVIVPLTLDFCDAKCCEAAIF